MVQIRALTADDVPAAQVLRAQAGWNQAEQDWRRLLAWDAKCCWVAEQDGRVVGTTTATTYGRRIAWIGMVLVDVDHRRQGIGRALLDNALTRLERRGIQTVALDSTPEGQPLYASLGFVDAMELARWRGPIPVSAAPSPGGSVAVRPIEAADLPAVAAYDARLFGVDRAHILGALQADVPAGCFLAERGGRTVGYTMSRPGAWAWHLGPLAADDLAAAEHLVRRALRPEARRGGNADFSEMVVDIMASNDAAVALARSLRLAPVRRFIRMVRGTPPPPVDAGRLYTSAGPELG